MHRLKNSTPEVKKQHVKEPDCLCRETSRRRLETQCHYCVQYLTVCVADNEVGHGGTEAAIYFKHVWAQSEATKTFSETKKNQQASTCPLYYSISEPYVNSRRKTCFFLGFFYSSPFFFLRGRRVELSFYSKTQKLVIYMQPSSA